MSTFQFINSLIASKRSDSVDLWPGSRWKWLCETFMFRVSSFCRGYGLFVSSYFCLTVSLSLSLRSYSQLGWPRSPSIDYVSSRCWQWVVSLLLLPLVLSHPSSLILSSSQVISSQRSLLEFRMIYCILKLPHRMEQISLTRPLASLEIGSQWHVKSTRSSE